jgi:hypothetical protein
MAQLKNIIFIFSIFLISLNFAVAKNCIQLNKDSVKVKWTAFKTPSKIGVSGLLKKITLAGPSTGTSIEEILLKSSFSLATDKTSLDSKNPARDAKIAKVFFSTLKNNAVISGRVKEIHKKKKVFKLTLNLNGVEKKLPLTFTIKKNKLLAEGFIDIFDYAMDSQLAALNKACFAKHEGKTWSDVKVQLSAKFEDCSK